MPLLQQKQLLDAAVDVRAGVVPPVSKLISHKSPRVRHKGSAFLRVSGVVLFEIGPGVCEIACYGRGSN